MKIINFQNLKNFQNKTITRKIILLLFIYTFISVFLFNQVFNFKIKNKSHSSSRSSSHTHSLIQNKSQNKDNESKDYEHDENDENVPPKRKELILKQYQVALLNKVKEGPLTPEQADEYFLEELKKEYNMKDARPLGIINMSENIRNKRLGRMNITGKNIKLLYPTDPEKTKYNYEQFKDNELMQPVIDKLRLDYEKYQLKDAETNFNKNPYENILDFEKIPMKRELINVKNRAHTDNLMKLAIEKEEKKYKDMVDNEISEIRSMKYNRGVITPLMNLKNERNIWEEEEFKRRMERKKIEEEERKRQKEIEEEECRKNRKIMKDLSDQTIDIVEKKMNDGFSK